MSAIRYQLCPACGDRWALPRDRCRTCGAAPETRESAGRGTVFSVTTQRRAPSRDFPVAPPWRIGLVDLDEGPRVMGILDDAARIGARVAGDMRPFAGADVATFTTDKEE